MAGANTDERNLLIAIECNTAAMAAAAGGTPVNCGGNDIQFNLLVQIAQNLKSTYMALGGAGVIENYTSALGLWQTIQCYTAGLTGLTGTASSRPGWVNTQATVQAIACNLAATLSNIGGTAVSENFSDYIPTLETIACLTEAIATHGFSPPDPVQEFINALLAFSPDVLLVGDRVSGASVTSWPDQSGHGANGAPTAGATPPARNVASVNGKNSVLFSGATNEIEGAYVNTSALSSVFVVYRNTVAGNGPTYVTTAKVAGGGDATAGQPVLCYDGSATPETNAYYGLFGSRAPSALNQFRLAAAFTDGANGTVYDTGTNITSGAYTGPLDTTLYCLGNPSNLAGGRQFAGDLAFVMLFKSDQTANLAAISAIINAYYGL